MEPTLGDLPPEEFRRLAREVADWMATYLEEIDGQRVYPDALEPGDVRRALAGPPPEEPEEMDEILADFRREVVPGLTHWNHPAFFGFFAISASGPGILGEMLAAALNVNALVWRGSPAATELEELTLDWLRAMLGLPEVFDGTINDTASTSTLYALAAARERAYPEVGRQGLFGQPPGRVYASEQAHSSVEKAVMALGLGRNGYRAVATDDDFRMDPEALRQAMEEDVAAGIRPMAVVPTLGTTSTTALDPVDRVVEVACAYDAWVHVDAAYGGPAALLPELRSHFQGWERADSIVVNPHKWLFTPVDCSVLYCQEPETLVRAFSLVPAYLRTPEGDRVKNLMDYGVALGRRFRSLKLWFILRAFGRTGLAARIRHHIHLARHLAEWIDVEPGWERMAPVPLGLVVFRYAPEGTDEAERDELNRALIEAANASGELFVGPTELGGHVVIRLSVGNIKTTEEHLSRAWRVLREEAAKLFEG